jgi:hypothetical protein
MGLAPRLLFTTCTVITRNQRITTAWDKRQEDNARGAAAGLPPRTRRRRRKPLTSLALTRHPAARTTTNTPARQREHARKQAPRTHSNQPRTQRTGQQAPRARQECQTRMQRSPTAQT